jgi:non-ribosomal peptide synthetase component E (peptide arylation enzyme)
VSDPIAQSRLDGLVWNEERLWPQFQALCAADPSALAVVDDAERRWSRSEIAEIASVLCRRLRELGVARGDRVAVTAHTTAPVLGAALAVSQMSAIFCPLSPSLSVTDTALLENRLGHTVKIAASPAGELTIEARDRALRSKDPRDVNTVLIGFTSGTSGIPKGVMHGPTALNYVTRACAANARLSAGEPILGTIPLYSAAGYTFTVHFSLSLGHPLVIIDKWNPVRAMQLIRRYSCAWATMVPTHLFMMVEAARVGDWHGTVPLRAVSVGGSTIMPELISDADQLLGLKALRMFGMSECLAHCSTHLDDALERRLLYDGTPFPKTEMEVFDANLAVLPRLQRGEAGVRGPALFLGYCDGLGAGQERMTSDGFYLTGDEIICDNEGFVRVVGRIKDQIIRGGFNIDPAEVETALLRHPAIAEVAVVAVPNRKLGEQACAVCRLRPGFSPINLAAMLEHLAEMGVSRPKWPEHLVLVDRMIILPIGKIDKKVMAAQAREELARRARKSGTDS